MLYLVSYDPGHMPEPFLRELAHLGKNLYAYPGAILLYTWLTAYGIRVRLLPHAAENAGFAVVQMYRGHCAGRLQAPQKEFIKKYIFPDPATRFRNRFGKN